MSQKPNPDQSPNHGQISGQISGQNPPPERYAALALQLTTACVNDCPDRPAARARMATTLAHVGKSVAASKAFVHQFSGIDVRLVVLPEYFLTGFPLGESVAVRRNKAALAIDGPEYRTLADIAERSDVYLAGNAYEVDPNFPELYFQSCFIIAPNRETVLRYRRMISLSGPTPYDVWDRYVEIYGLDGVFPVADTPIGRLAAIASEEIQYPEIARMTAMRGAEIYVHSSSEIGSPSVTTKEIGRRARAAENIAYVVSANSASLTHCPIPAESTTGMSKIVDYYGQIMVEASPGGESMVANATIDLGALRERRRKTGLSNVLVRQPFQAYAERYGDTVFRPANLLLDGANTRIPSRQEFSELQRADIERLASTGKI
ncbi:MAG: nitrilase-related carbon-nitrogen hydrolase [Gammaproteobacteria bacterium]